MNLPSVRAEVTLVPSLEHPRWPNLARYMPHIVIGDPSQREVHIRDGNQPRENSRLVPAVTGRTH
jgi:hypothetical protein